MKFPFGARPIFRGYVSCREGNLNDTVDGSEFLDELIGSLSHNLTGFCNIPGGCLGFLPSTLNLRPMIFFGHECYPSFS